MASEEQWWEPRLRMVRLGAGSGRYLSSESISGAPTVCSILGMEVFTWRRNNGKPDFLSPLAPPGPTTTGMIVPIVLRGN